jgi:xylose isomerase
VAPQVTESLAAHQKKTGIKLLWGTANLFSNPRYACGAATNPSLDVFTYAAAQVKKAMDVTFKLGGALRPPPPTDAVVSLP